MFSRRGGSYPYELVDWSKIQQYLHHAQCDVLTILNCCYAGKTDLGNMNGTNEILAASDWDTMAWALDRSFLKVLVHELGKLANCKFSIDTLRHQLDIDNTIPGVKLINHPFHKRYPTADHPSILLQPLPTSGTVSRRATSSLQDMSIPCFYVRLTLDEAESLPKADWISFFATARFPSLVRNLHFYTQDSLMEQVCRDIAG